MLGRNAPARNPRSGDGRVIHKVSFKTVPPQLGTAIRFDELPTNPQPATSLADTALKDVAGSQFSANLPHVDRAAFESEAGIPRDNG